jgi:nucleoside-diphosphate-sugar epimerase
MRVAVFGASGFVGATLVERLWAEGGVEVRPIIHSSGNAARLARSGQSLVMADLMSPPTVEAAVAGCTHVVNCARGPGEVMTRGLQHLLDASRTAGVQRFVHLSSVAAYGDAVTGAVTEDATPQPAKNTYGAMKFAQDQLVAKAAQSGLSTIVLCPPNISGPYSAYLLEIIETIRRGQFALVDEGRQLCELVDVANLVEAIRLALNAKVSDAQRIFVTDGRAVAWADLARALQPFADSNGPLPTVSLADAQRIVERAEPPSPTVRRALRHLVSADVRQALKRDAWFGQAERTLKTAIRRMPALDQNLRKRFGDAPGAPKAPKGPTISARLLKQQLRAVSYSQTRARDVLGYSPVLNWPQSMAAFDAWYRVHYGFGDEWWPLLQHLRAPG